MNLTNKKPRQALSRLLQPVTNQEVHAEIETHARYNSIRGIIVHSSLSRDIAHRMRRRCAQDFSVAHPGMEHEFLLYELPDSFESAQTVLAQEQFLHEGGSDDEACFQFLITVGVWEANVVAHVRSVTLKPIPHMYCLDGAFAPKHEDAHDDENQYGVIATPTTATEYVDGLLSIKPDIKSVALLFDPRSLSTDFNAFILDRCRSFVDELKARGVLAYPVTWNASSDNASFCDRVKDRDAIIVLEGPTIEAHRNALVDMCDTHKILLCTTELDSVFMGASLGCGLTTAAYATPLVRMISTALSLNVYRNHDLFVIKKQDGLRFNEDALRKQGVVLTAQQAALLRMRCIYSISIVEY